MTQLMQVLGNGVAITPFKLPGGNLDEGEKPTPIFVTIVEEGRLTSIVLPRVRGVYLVRVAVGTRNYLSAHYSRGIDLSARALQWHFDGPRAPVTTPGLGVLLEFRAARPVRISRAALWYMPLVPRYETQPYRGPFR